MAQKFANDWLRDVIERGRDCALLPQGPRLLGSETLLLDTVFSLQPYDFERIIRPIQDFQGTKLMVSCTDRTPLENVIKQAICFADLVIIVPAPLWVSCTCPASILYAEFNFESVALRGCWNVAMGLIKNMSGLVVDECQAFDDGAVTFLPVPGESLKRWSHPELSLPQLPYPYSGSQGQHTTFDAHIEGLYGLCSERLAAECLGAMYLNSASFTKPVFGDLTVGKLTQSGHRGRSVIEISIPDLSALSLEGVLRLRHEIPDMSSQFSRAILNVLRPDGVYGQNTEPAIEDLRASAASWTRQIESVLPRNAFGHGDRLVQTTFVLGLGGSGGNTMSTVDFVLKGGTLQDLVKVITEGEEVRLEIRDDSMLAAA